VFTKETERNLNKLITKSYIRDFLVLVCLVWGVGHKKTCTGLRTEIPLRFWAILPSPAATASSYATPMRAALWPSCEYKEVAVLYAFSITDSVQWFSLQFGCTFHHFSMGLKATGCIMLVPDSLIYWTSYCTEE